MKKGQRPSRHVRRVHTRRGVKPALVNPSISKRTTNKQYRRMMRRMAPFADADGDGVKNIEDCRPFNRKRQDSADTARELAEKKARAEEEREEKRREKEIKEKHDAEIKAAEAKKKREEKEAKEREAARKKNLEYEEQKRIQHEFEIKTAKEKAKIDREEEQRREKVREEERKERQREKDIERYGAIQVAIAEMREKRAKEKAEKEASKRFVSGLEKY